MFRKLRERKCLNAIIGIKSLGSYRYNNAKSSHPYFLMMVIYRLYQLGDNSFDAQSEKSIKA